MILIRKLQLNKNHIKEMEVTWMNPKVCTLFRTNFQQFNHLVRFYVDLVDFITTTSFMDNRP